MKTEETTGWKGMEVRRKGKETKGKGVKQVLEERMGAGREGGG